MRIVWDERKRLANLDKHQLDFADIDDGFFLAAYLRPAKGERIMAIGRFADGTIAVIFAKLGSEGIAIISMRPAHATERRLLNGSKEN
jgi:uncharacterized DUF497 family protein